MKKYFYNSDEDIIQPLSYWKKKSKKNGLTIILEEEKRDMGGEMWCEISQDFILGHDFPCGNLCNYYDPCNGKSGRCAHLKNGFIGTGKKIIIENGHVK